MYVSRMTPIDRLVGYDSGVARSRRCHPSDVFAVRMVHSGGVRPALGDGCAASLGPAPAETTRPTDDPPFAATPRSTDTPLPTDTEVHTDG
jgi:hypothetical protein